MAARVDPLRRLCRDERAVAALEFAICAPLFIGLLLTGVDTARYIIAAKRLESVAATVGQMTSVSTTGQVSDTDLRFYRDSAMVIFPQLLSESYAAGISWTSDVGITISGITFTASGSTYTPHLTWSGGTAPRSCTVTMTAAADTASPSPSTLPTDVFGPTSIVVVDVTYSFHPLVAPGFMSTLPIKRSYYVSPRYVSSITYSGAASTFATSC